MSTKSPALHPTAHQEPECNYGYKGCKTQHPPLKSLVSAPQDSGEPVSTNTPNSGHSGKDVNKTVSGDGVEAILDWYYLGDEDVYTPEAWQEHKATAKAAIELLLEKARWDGAVDATEAYLNVLKEDRIKALQSKLKEKHE